MGKTKLTLSVDRKIVAHAKAFARIHDTSVSRLVESFLRRLDVPGDHESSAETPLVSRLRGLGNPSGGLVEYRRHVEKKYGR
jgi:hypothetical protein